MGLDSPLCPSCKLDGWDANTYKVAGRPMFKCGRCKNTFHSTAFKDEDFKWKDSGKIELWNRGLEDKKK